MKNLLLISCMLTSVLAAGQKMVVNKIGEDKDIQLSLPENFYQMSDQDRMQQVSSSKVPIAMFTTLEQDVTLGVNYNVMEWKPEDTPLVKDFYKASFQNLFDKIEFIQDEVKKINGREFVVFEFVGTIVEDNAFASNKTERNYTYIQYTSWKDQVLLFNFSCRARLKNQWEGVAKEIMESVTIK